MSVSNIELSIKGKNLLLKGCASDLKTAKEEVVYYFGEALDYEETIPAWQKPFAAKEVTRKSLNAPSVFEIEFVIVKSSHRLTICSMLKTIAVLPGKV